MLEKKHQFGVKICLRIKNFYYICEMKNPKINTPKGVGEIETVCISELGFLMIRVYYEDKTYVSYNLGKHDVNENVFTDKIMNDVR
jgi:hypothetical protein